jgi:hypothetical protein
VPWAIDELQKFVDLTATRSVGRVPMPTPEALVVAQAPVAEAILDHVLPDWRTSITKLQSLRWYQHREAAQRAITLLVRQDELRERLGDGAPVLDAGRFHPWAWDGARSMWQSRHYRQGVVDALKKVNAEAQNKTGRHDLSETGLFKQLFALKPPAPNEPRLRLREDEGSDTFKSVHVGAMALAEGLFAGIRNVVSHTVAETEADEQHALEQLAAVSVLARWVAEATVVTVP